MRDHAHFLLYKKPRPELTAGKQHLYRHAEKEIKHIDHSLYARVNKTVTTPAAQPRNSTEIVYILLSVNLDIYRNSEKPAVSRPEMISLQLVRRVASDTTWTKEIASWTI